MRVEDRILAAMLPYVDGLRRDRSHLFAYAAVVLVVAFSRNQLVFSLAVLALCAPLLASVRMTARRGSLPFPWPSWHLIMSGKLGKPVVPYLENLWDYLMRHSKRFDPDSIVEAFDRFCWDTPTMNVGDVKGLIVDGVLRDCKPMVAAEFGAHLGYSTVRMARLLPPGGMLHSVDPSPLTDPFRRALVSLAGLEEKVEFVYEFSDEWMKQVAANGLKLDFLFIDHVKDLYLSDLLLALELGIFAPGATIVADNVLTPGCPDYRAWMLEGDGKKLFQTRVHRTTLEYHDTLADEVLVSVLQ